MTKYNLTCWKDGQLEIIEERSLFLEGLRIQAQSLATVGADEVRISDNEGTHNEKWSWNGQKFEVEGLTVQQLRDLLFRIDNQDSKLSYIFK